MVFQIDYFPEPAPRAGCTTVCAYSPSSDCIPHGFYMYFLLHVLQTLNKLIIMKKLDIID